MLILHSLTKRVAVLESSRMISKLNQISLLSSSPSSRTQSTSLVPRYCFLKFQIQCSSSSTDITSGMKLSVSRAARTDAQSALFDYLHCTRGFNFTDAEHISKNSPHFVQGLLSRVENEQDVSRALSKFFRYHPINEFEPFLESLGLGPSEFAALLPRDFMFLSDDCVMLENFHLLCGYGVPRTKIGKMYKEATEIFGYGLGVLETKLSSYEQLGLSKSTVIKLVTCCPSLLIGDINCDLVAVLEKLRRFGFENDWIGGYLWSKRAYNWSRMLDTINFLEDVGYSDAQIGALFKKNPAMLFEGSGKRIHVCTGLLLKLGFKMDEVYALFLRNAEMISPKCVKYLCKAIHFLFGIGMDTENIARFVSDHIQLLTLHPLKGPKTVLREFNNDRLKLCQIIQEDPLKLFVLASKSNSSSIEQLASQNPGKLLDKTAFLRKLGYIENSDEMAKALKLFRGRGDQLQERFDCLVQAGLDCNVVSGMIKRAPTVLNQSKEVLEKKIECLRNYLGYPVQSIVTFPSYLCYDIERINLRFSMYAWLRKIGAAKPTLSVSTLLACSDARFVKYFVNVHPEAPAKWESLKKSFLAG